MTGRADPAGLEDTYPGKHLPNEHRRCRPDLGAGDHGEPSGASLARAPTVSLVRCANSASRRAHPELDARWARMAQAFGSLRGHLVHSDNALSQRPEKSAGQIPQFGCMAC